MRRTTILMICLLLGACASPVKEGEQLINEGKIQAGMAKLDELVKQDPGNAEYRIARARNKEEIVGQKLIDADRLREQGSLDEAEALYRSTFEIDKENQRAKDGLNSVKNAREQLEKVVLARKLIKERKPEQARIVLREVLAQSPRQVNALDLIRGLDQDETHTAPVRSLGGAFAKKVSLEFRDAPLSLVFTALAQQTGLNFIMDKDVRPDLRSTIVVRNVPLSQALNLILATSQLDKKALNENTLLIYPNQPAKQKDYQEMVVRSFYLANADPKTTLSMIKTLLKTRDVFIDEKLNLLIMRDTREVISMAEKLIAVQDRAEPEVMLEIEVLEVSRTRLLEMGIQYPNSATLVPVGGGTSTTAPNLLLANQLRHISGADIAISPVTANLNKVDTDTVILANPRIRVKNREKAKIHIGDRVPVISAVSTANVGTSDSVTYLDTGLKLEVEPNVYLNDDVGIKLSLEVSTITKQIISEHGTLTYQLGTREASTVLRLKNGETQVLAGLINNQEQDSANKIPGLGDLPLIGRLFSNHRNDGAKTEIVLLVTPHIVRNVSQPEPDIIEFESGTDSNMGGAALRLQPSVIMAPSQETLPITLPMQPVPGPNGSTFPNQDVFRPSMPPPIQP